MQDTPSLLETELSGEAGEPPSAFVAHPEGKEEEQCDAEEPPSLSTLDPVDDSGDLVPEPAWLVIHYTRFFQSKTRSFRKYIFKRHAASERLKWQCAIESATRRHFRES